MGFFQNLFTDVKEAAEGAADGSASEDALNERLNSLRTLQNKLGSLSNAVEALVCIFERSIELRKRKKDAIRGNPAAYKAFEERMNTLMAQNRKLVDSISSIQTTFDSFLSKTDPGMTEAESAEFARLNELYEKLETCQSSNDTEGGRKVQEEIQTIMSGGSSLTDE